MSGQASFDIPAPFTAAIVVSGRRVYVRYRAGVGEDVEIRRLRGRASEAEHNGEPPSEVLRLYRLLAVRVIEAWDWRDEEGLPVPVTVDALRPLPIGALQRIVREATQGTP